VFRNNPSLGPDKALDDDSATRWATDGGIHEAWLEVDLGAPTAIGRVMIDEPEEYKRVQAFELQFKDGDAWKTFHKGTAIGPRWTAKFEPVTARYVRLNILKAADGPTIWEFQLFAPGK
jgi:alpha-L-fucosidase